MKILKVIHGYPMLYNAGSEVYSQTICHGLVKHGHDVQVFTREEDPFRPDGAMRITHDQDEPQIKVHLVNNPRHRDRYRLAAVDQSFAKLLDYFQPDLVHIGHLNHLSTSLVFEAKKRNLPVIYTLHDYWLMCPRGQFMQMHSADDNLWAACAGQENRKCAIQCYARYFSGADEDMEHDIAYWEQWVSRRMAHIRTVVAQVDLFIAPAQYLKKRYEQEFGLPASKSVYLDYGFDHKRMNNRKRQTDELFTFGYIGTHIPAKGVHHLIQAFGKLSGDCQLYIWGRDRGQDSQALRALVANLPATKQQNVTWLPEYKNQHITEGVFNNVDVIVTPSIWVENSPLVIHEAQQAHVPIITADAGGMSEYVQHEVNGLLYPHRDIDGLATQMQRLLDNPKLAQQLGERGYLFNKNGEVPAIDQHITELEAIYKRAMI